MIVYTTSFYIIEAKLNNTSTKLPIDIIILAVIAIFFLWKLRSVLGTEGQDDAAIKIAQKLKDAAQKAQEARNKAVEEDGARVVHDAAVAPSPTPEQVSSVLQDAYDELRSVDANFTLRTFVGGAQAMFEKVLQCFAQADFTELGKHVSPEIFDNFQGAIDARKVAEHEAQISLISVEAEVIGMRMDGSVADITVQFESEQIRFTKDRAGKVVEGSTTDIENVRDVWTFRRDLRGKSKSWQLVMTEGV